MVEQQFLIRAAQVKACRRVLNAVLRVSYSGIYFGPHPLFLVSVLFFFTSIIGWFWSAHLPSAAVVIGVRRWPEGAGGDPQIRERAKPVSTWPSLHAVEAG